MQLRYTGPHDIVEVPDAELIAKRGETVEVPDTIAASLIAQGTWTTTTKTPAKPAGGSN
jgi:hypothetical protein